MPRVLALTRAGTDRRQMRLRKNMKFKRIIGIDPGLSGGLAFITDDGDIVTHKTKSTPPLEALQDATAGVEPFACVAYMERIGGFIKGKHLPGSSMFKMGHNAGYWEGACAALGIRLILIRPQDWQAGIPGTAGKAGVDRKRALCAEAIRRFPSIHVTQQDCDALLIADFARKVEGCAA